MRVAITHDWLIGVGGPERVLEQLLRLYPEAHLYTGMDHLPASDRRILLDVPVFTSMLQKMPLVARSPRRILPLLPLAMQRFDLSGYDLIISNSRFAAKCVKTRPGQLHIGYMSTASRFRWDLQLRHLEERGRSPVGSRLTSLLLDHLRVTDEASTARVDRVVASSRSVATRLGASYQRPTHVIYPPVDVDFWSPQAGLKREDFYLTLGCAGARGKNDPVVEAFSSMPHRRLLVARNEGDRNIMGEATTNVEPVEIGSNEQLRDLMRRARALVHGASDEMGLVMAEAQGCGLPVIALGRGTALEIVRGLDHEAPSGVHFEDRHPAAIIDAVERFEREKYRIYSTACRESAIRFRPEAFRAQFSALVSEAVAESRWAVRRPLLQISRETPVSCRVVEETLPDLAETAEFATATVDVYA